MPTSDDMQFKDLTLKNNLITAQQMDECLHTSRNYEQAGIVKPLSSIVLEKGLMTLKQINAIHHLQGKQDQYIIRGYTILENIGQGGLGTVYKARQDSMGRTVALKVMYPNLADNPQFLQRFMREAKVCASLEHPNIVKGIDFGESDGIYFFVMEFVDGDSLKDVIQRHGHLGEKDAVEIVIQVAKALKYAEEHNMVHRDIKPENILLTREGVVKVCDLGLAKTIEEELSVTQTGIVVGTPHYISPEQGMGRKDLDIRSDIYSLGITCYYMVTGDLPYHGPSAVNVIGQHITGEAPNPRQKKPDLSEEICTIITTMMAKKREERYQTAQELLVDLMRFLRHEKPVVRPKPKEDSDEVKATRVAEKPVSSRDTRDHSDLRDSAIAEGATLDLAEQSVSDEIEIITASKEKSSAFAAVAEDWQIGGREEEIREPVRQTDPQESRKFVQKLEEKVGKSRRGFGLKKVIAVIIICGVLVAGYRIRQMVIRQTAYGDSGIAGLFRKFFGEDAPKVTMEPMIADIPGYQAWQRMAELRQQHEEECKTIGSANLPPDRLAGNMKKICGAAWEGQTLADYYIDEYQVKNRDYCNFCEATGHPEPQSWTAATKAGDSFLESAAVDISYYDAALYAAWLGKRLPSEAEWVSAQGILQVKDPVWEWTTSFYGAGEMDYVVRTREERDGYFPGSARKDLGFRCALSASEK